MESPKLCLAIEDCRRSGGGFHVNHFRKFFAIVALAGSIAPTFSATAQDITAIRKLELYAENTDADPANDSVKVYVIFGDANASDIRPPDGAVFPFKCNIFEYVNDQQGRLIGSATGTLKSERGFLSFLVRLPSVKSKMRIFAQVQATLPSGKSVEGKRTDTFDPHRH